MIISRAHKIRLDPNRAQEEYFRRACGIRRMAFNWGLAEWNKRYEAHKADETKPKPSWMAIRKLFNAIKREQFPWITEVSSRIPERGIQDMGRAWTNWFQALKRGDKRFRPPRFEAKGRNDRFYVHNQELRFTDSHVVIGRLGAVRIREPLRFNGKVMGATVSRTAGDWSIAVQVQFEQGEVPRTVGEAIGVDLGVAHQVATSDGDLYALPIKRMEELRIRIRLASRALSRKWSGRIKKGHADEALRDEEGQLKRASGRFRRQANRLAKLHQQLADVRKDALHNLSRKLVEQYETIAIEDLALAKMTASAKGTIEVTVHANAGAGSPAA